MSTHSTVTTVKAQLVAKLTTALATASPDGGQVQVSYAWPGSATQPESVFLGTHPAVEDIRTTVAIVDPTIKAGRRLRQETYKVPISIWSFRPDLTSADAQQAEARAFAIDALIEGMLANDPLIGLEPTVVQHVLPSDLETALFPHESGWAAVLLRTVEVAARLT